MKKKMVTVKSNPLLYIAQPVYPPVTQKMQQSYVLKADEPSQKEEADSAIEAATSTTEKLIEDNENATSLKKNPTEEQTNEENREKFENVMKDKCTSMDDVFNGKPVHIINSSDQLQSFVAKKEEATFETAETEENRNPIMEEQKKIKRNKLIKLGIQSSIEKGKKAIDTMNKITSTNEIEEKETKEELESNELGENIQSLELHEQEQNDQSLELQQQEQREQSPEPQQQKQSETQEHIQSQVIEKKLIDKRPRKFKEMTIEEKVDYLVNLPTVVPKIKCDIKTKEDHFQGIVSNYENGFVEILQQKDPHQIKVKIDDIIAINRKSF